MSSSVFAVDAISYRMQVSLKQTIQKIKRYKLSGLREISEAHYLQGSFKQLCDPRAMQEVLFPGTPLEKLKDFPRNLFELLEWDEIVLDLDRCAKSAAEVLINIKLKGSKQGNYMDEMTEAVILPQIAQEALAKALIDAVRALNRKVSVTIAKAVKNVASISDERSLRNQIDSDIIDLLTAEKYMVQREYLGDDWVSLIQRDLLRFVQYEKLSFIDENGAAVVPSSSLKSSLSSFPQMAWIERDDKMNDQYPALSELLDQIYSLPFELNAKCSFEGFQLLEPSKGCTMLVKYPAGSKPKMRLDSRSDTSDLDSGIRVTCAYHIRLSSELSTSSGHVIGEIKNNENLPESSLIFGKSTNDEPQYISLENDMLSIHLSSEVKNGRTADLEADWIAIYFFIQGKDLAST